MAWIYALILILSTVNVYASDIIFPLDKNIVTGSFSEFRWNHFHTGLDLSTDGEEGKAIYAPADSWVNYLKRDFYGYANTVFLEDENYIYVFGHMQKFNEKLTSLLSDKRFKQILYPKKNEIKIKKGEVIGFTGSSGTTSPHLHFEIRSKNNNPINPLLLYSIEDNEYPEIYGILVEPADDTTLINGRHDIVYVSATKIRKGEYNVSGINISGKYTLGIKVIDKINSISAKLFVYRIEMFSSMKRVVEFTLDSVSFDLSKISPSFFRADVPVKQSNYLFNLNPPKKSWLFDSESGILSSAIDTIIQIAATDKMGNSSAVEIKIVNSKKYQKEYISETKLKKVNNRITLIMSGNNARENVSSVLKANFREYNVSENYRYFVYEKLGEEKEGFSVDGLVIGQNIVHLDQNAGINLSNDIRIESKSEVSFLYSIKEQLKRGVVFRTPLYEIKLSDRFLVYPVKIIINGHKGESFFMYHNGVYSIIKNLKDIDTVFTNTLSSFILGIDIVKPKSNLIKKKYRSSGFDIYTYSLRDNESGIDWNFVADSNDIYNEPNHFTGRVKIKVPSGDSFKFVIKDKAGNKDTINLY